VRVCFDTGHAHLAGGVQPAFDTLKNAVSTVHLNDNLGQNDDHMMPFSGTIEWKPVVEALGALNEQSPLLLEPRDYGPEQSSMAKVGEVARRIKEEVAGVREQGTGDRE
jgi:sugar phosphate isomerase/epimerase